MVKKVLVFSLFFLLIGGVAFAEPYKGKSPPPHEIIQKNIAPHYLDGEYVKQSKITVLGVSKDCDGSYRVHFEWAYMGKNFNTRKITQKKENNRVKLIRLDNKLWMLAVGPSGQEVLIQK